MLRTEAGGFAAAGGGALVGALLGFHAAEGLFALVTAIAGAIAGANLALIVLEMWRAGAARARDHAAHEPPVDVPEPTLEPAAPSGGGRR